jgi:hypothetical protein
MAEKICPLALSTTPLDWGWYTDAKQSFVPIERQYSLKYWQSNRFPLSIMSSLGTPNLQIICCQKNFLMVTEVILVRGLASITWWSTQPRPQWTCNCLGPLAAVRRCPFPSVVMAKWEWWAAMEPQAFAGAWLWTDKLCKSWQSAQHLLSPLANRNPSTHPPMNFFHKLHALVLSDALQQRCAYS